MNKWTEKDSVIASMINKEYKWIAMNSRGEICLYELKPSKNEMYWTDEHTYTNFPRKIFRDVFNSLSWDDTEPTLIQDIIDRKEEPILDEVEKRYLSGVIRPFRSKVVGIRKDVTNNGECIVIMLRDNPNIFLPYFKKNTMYKGIKTCRAYTLEELDL